MCGTSQRQYELGQKQGKTLVISRLPSGGTGARQREESRPRNNAVGANELTREAERGTTSSGGESSRMARSAQVAD